ncbi:hypothetical protein PC116_g1265 [Phytophthora cactorum]|nr:hypothetical protein PC116_g1265 [Phytophthora cactorum]
MRNVPGEGRTATCFQIWHADWNNGNGIPRELEQEHMSRDRPPTLRPSKKRRRRMEADSDQPTGGAKDGGDASSDEDE